MKILLFMLVIQLIIRLMYRKKEVKNVEQKDVEFKKTTFDPSSFQIREEFEYRNIAG